MTRKRFVRLFSETVVSRLSFVASRERPDTTSPSFWTFVDSASPIAEGSQRPSTRWFRTMLGRSRFHEVLPVAFRPLVRRCAFLRSQLSSWVLERTAHCLLTFAGCGGPGRWPGGGEQPRAFVGAAARPNGKAVDPSQAVQVADPAAGARLVHIPAEQIRPGIAAALLMAAPNCYRKQRFEYIHILKPGASH